MDWETTVGIGSLRFIANQTQQARKHILSKLKRRNPAWRIVPLFGTSLFLDKTARAGAVRPALAEKMAEDLKWLMNSVLWKQVQLAEANDARTRVQFEQQCAKGQERYARFTPGSVVKLRYYFRWFGGMDTLVTLGYEIPVDCDWQEYPRPGVSDGIWQSPSLLQLTSPPIRAKHHKTIPYPLVMCPATQQLPTLVGLDDSTRAFILSLVHTPQLKFLPVQQIRSPSHLQDCQRFGDWHTVFSEPHAMTACQMHCELCYHEPAFSPAYFKAVQTILSPFVIHDLTFLILFLAGAPVSSSTSGPVFPRAFAPSFFNQ